jgi:hypothetical protein
MSQMGPTTAVISALALGPLHLSQPASAARVGYRREPGASGRQRGVRAQRRTCMLDQGALVSLVFAKL